MDNFKDKECKINKATKNNYRNICRTTEEIIPGCVAHGARTSVSSEK
jgi:hypothetical protein